jgi:SAM-dependent methyltransferase
LENDDTNYAASLRRHYAPLVATHGDSFRAVDWGSPESQKKRFEVLLGAMDFRFSAILDVGCGVGHLAGYLNENCFRGSYMGIDLVPEMVKKARSLHVGMEFKVAGALRDLDGFEPDLVVASGLFAFADFRRLKDTIRDFFPLARHALTFNSLSSWKLPTGQNEFHADPVETLQFCSSLSKRVVLRHDYLPHDFSIYLYKG